MKAVVLETRGREAAVLAMDGTVRVVHGRYSVGETIDCGTTVRRTLVRWTAAAAAMVMLLGGSAAMWVDRNYVACAEVSLDVNPSIAYTVNKRDRVLSVRAVNADAEGIVDSLQQDGVRFAPLTDAVERTMALLEDEGYLDAQTEDYVLLNVSADDEARQTRLSDEVESAMTKTMEHDATLEYRIDRSDRDTARRAAESGMSTGRYALWEQAGEAQHGGEPPKQETYSDMPVRDMMGNRSGGTESRRAEPESTSTGGADAQPEREHGQDMNGEGRKDMPSESGSPEGSPGGSSQPFEEAGSGPDAGGDTGGKQGEAGQPSEGDERGADGGSGTGGKQGEAGQPSEGARRGADGGSGTGGKQGGSSRRDGASDHGGGGGKSGRGR